MLDIHSRAALLAVPVGNQATLGAPAQMVDAVHLATAKLSPLRRSRSGYPEPYQPLAATLLVVGRHLFLVELMPLLHSFRICRWLWS